MVNIKDIRHDLIDLIMQINNSDMLISVYDSLDRRTDKKKMNVDEAVVDLLPLPTLDEISKNQKTNKLVFSDLKIKAQSIDWKFTLDEMLSGLN